MIYLKKTYLLIALFLIFSSALAQQNLNWKWVRTAGGLQNQKATSIAVDNNNDVVIAGTFTSSYISLGTNNVILSNNDTNSFSSNYFIAKYNQNGEVIWAKKAFCNTATSSNKLVTDNIGNIYASGFINNSNAFINTISFDGNSTFTHNNGGKSFLVKYSPQGTTQWVIFTNNKYWGYDTISTLKYDKNSNSILIGGYCLGDTVSIGGFNIINSGNNMHSSFIAKVNIQQGNILWLKNSKGNSYINKINDIALDTAGSIYTAASFLGSYLILPSDDTLVNSSPASGVTFTDGYIAKYDKNGIFQWSKKGVCLTNDEVTSITYLNNNKLVAGGYNNSQFTTNGISLNGTSFIIEYDLQGNFIDAKTFPATIKTIKANKNSNGYVLGGTFTSDSLIFGNLILFKKSNPFSLNTNIFIASSDNFGIYNAAISAGGYGSVSLNDLIISDSNKIYTCGSFNQPSIYFDSTQYFANGVSDLFLAKSDTGFSFPIPLKYNLGGTVFAGLLPVDHATAYLYNINQNITDTCQIDSLGFYQFYQKPIGNYKVSAVISSISVYYNQNYITSFYPDKTTFADAETILLNTNRWGRNIQLQKSSTSTENIYQNSDLKIYPNPAKNEIYISVKDIFSEIYKIEIINLNGQIVFDGVYKKNIGNENININIASFKTGLYYLILRDYKGNISNSKFIKPE